MESEKKEKKEKEKYLPAAIPMIEKDDDTRTSTIVVPQGQSKICDDS